MGMMFEKKKRKNPPGGENSGRWKKKKNKISKKRKVKDQEGKKEREITSGALILVPDSLTEGVVSCERTQIAVP